MTEAFDPTSYRHTHAPNETCDVCALLVVIGGLQAARSDAATIREKQYGAKDERKFVAYFYFVGWDSISLGAHVCWSKPNVEIHLPFGFIRIGWRSSRFPTRWQLGRATGFAD
jgi:hypothetical protein